MVVRRVGREVGGGGVRWGGDLRVGIEDGREREMGREEVKAGERENIGRADCFCFCLCFC